MQDEQPLQAATVVAIIALWFHVALSIVLMFVVDGAHGDAGGTVFPSLASAVAYAAIAIGLYRRHPSARVWGIAVSATAYVIGLPSGRVLSTVLFILIPLLLVRTAPPRYSLPPKVEERLPWPPQWP